MQSTSESPSSRRPFLRGLLAGGLFGGLFGSAFGALAQDDRCRRHGAWSGRHGGDPEAMKTNVQRRLDHLLDRLQADDAQRTRIKTAAAQALDELEPLRKQHQAHRSEMISALSQPAIDREALDRLRKAEVALADGASATLVASLADMAETLTPDQRAQLAQMTQHWRGRHRG